MMKLAVATEHLLAGERADPFTHSTTQHGHCFEIVVGRTRLIVDLVRDTDELKHDDSDRRTL